MGLLDCFERSVLLNQQPENVAAFIQKGRIEPLYTQNTSKCESYGKQFCCAMSFFDSSNSTSYCEMRKSSVRTKMAAISSHFEVF